MPFINKPLNLLVVEDNPGDFTLLATYLQQTNLKIERLHHVEKLSELNNIDQKKIDLAFLDLSLPDSSGTESFFILSQMMPWLPIIVLLCSR